MAKKQRKHWLAGLLTIFSIGLGHLYAGEAKRGILLFLGQGFLFVLLSLLLFVSPLLILIVTACCAMGYLLFYLLDAVRIAGQNRAYQLKKYNRWYVYLGCWLPWSSRLLLRSFLRNMYPGS
jgi:signal peptidase I